MATLAELRLAATTVDRYLTNLLTTETFVTLHVAQPPYILHGSFTERRGWLQPSSPHAGVAPAVSGRPVRFVRAVVSVTAGRTMTQMTDAVRTGGV